MVNLDDSDEDDDSDDDDVVDERTKGYIDPYSEKYASNRLRGATKNEMRLSGIVSSDCDGHIYESRGEYGNRN